MMICDEPFRDVLSEMYDVIVACMEERAFPEYCLFFAMMRLGFIIQTVKYSHLFLAFVSYYLSNQMVSFY